MLFAISNASLGFLARITVGSSMFINLLPSTEENNFLLDKLENEGSLFSELANKISSSN